MIDERADIVGEQAVKAHVAKAQLVVAAAQLLLPIGTQRQRCMAAADDRLVIVSALGVAGCSGQRLRAFFSNEAIAVTPTPSVAMAATVRHFGGNGR